MRASHRYKERDYGFGEQIAALRRKAGLRQEDLAQLLQVSVKTLQNWEGGSSYPSTAHLKDLIAAYLQYGAFSLGQEGNEARMLWEHTNKSASLARGWNVDAPTSQSKAVFETSWFDALLAHYQQAQANQKDSIVPLANHVIATVGREVAPHQNSLPVDEETNLRCLDWGEAIDTSVFYGRESELATLEHWILTDRCRLITLVGMGGIGKSALSVKLLQQLAPHFTFVLWRSLRNAPTIEELLADCLPVLSEQHVTLLPRNVEEGMSQFIHLLQERRCLLVLDNIETILQEQTLEGRWRDGYEDYGILLKRIAEASHQSCLLLTSREMPRELEPLQAQYSTIRSWKLTGLEHTAGKDLLQEKGLFGEQDAWKTLIQRYAGNPLALKIVGAVVQDLFVGDIAAFLQEGVVSFQNLRVILNQELARLSPLERDLMLWLAIEREAVSLEVLQKALVPAVPKRDLFEAMLALRRRCLVERAEHEALYLLQPVVLECMTDQLIEQVSAEIERSESKLLHVYALMRSQTKDYVRESQIRLIVRPLLDRLRVRLGSRDALTSHLVGQIERLRMQPPREQSYAAGNLINLLASLNGQVNALDCSHLTIREMYLQRIQAQGTSFEHCHLQDCMFTETLDSVVSIAISSDGAYGATGEFNGVIRIWNLPQGRLLHTLSGHTMIVITLAFSLDGSLLASGSYDHTARLWDVETGQCVNILRGHTNWTNSVAFHPSGLMLATCSEDGAIRVWDVARGLCLKAWSGHADHAVLALSFCANGLLVSKSKGVDSKSVGEMKIWDITNEPVRCLGVIPLDHEEAAVPTVAVQPAGTILVSTDLNMLKLWEMHREHRVRILQGSTDPIWSVAFSLDGGLLVSGSYNGTIKVWHVETGKCVKTLAAHASRIWSLAFGERILGSASNDGTIKFWSVDQTGEQVSCLRTLQGYSGAVFVVAYSPDGTLVATGDRNGVLRIWAVSQSGETTECLRTIQGHDHPVTALAFSPDSCLLASGGGDCYLKLWDARQGQHLKTFQEHGREIWSVAFNPDGTLLAWSARNSTVGLCDVHSGHSLLMPKHDSDWVWTVTFSPDGKILATGDGNGVIHLWEVQSVQCLRTIQASPDFILALAFTRDSTQLVSSNNKEILAVWSVESGVCLKTVTGSGHTNWANMVVFSRHGDLLAIITGAYMVEIRQVSDGMCLRTIASRVHRVWSVAFNADATILACGYDDATVILFDVQTGKELSTLRSQRPYDHMQISNVTGLTEAQKMSLLTLGASDER